jgi:membrane AbrB-like protein
MGSLRHPDWAAIRRLLLALGLGALGGAVFAWLRLPLPWMLGAMSATMAASIGGLPVAIPHSWRLPMLGILGVMLGSGFTAEVAAGMLRWLGSIAALPVYIVVSLSAALLFLRRWAKLEAVTAFFSAAPGGLTEMVFMGDGAGGDSRTISLVHATRVFIVVFMVPFLVRLVEGIGVAAPQPSTALPTAWELSILAGCLVLGLWAGPLLRLPAAFLLGPLLASAAAHVAGMVHSAPPRPFVILAQLIIGAGLGCRFAGLAPWALARTMLLGGGVSIVLLACTMLIAQLVHQGTGLPYVALVLAFAPGGIAEMGLVALALGSDPLFVATHHVIRIGLVVLLAPLLFKLWKRWR